MEFWNIFPVWDWRKIPGITCEQNGQPLVCDKVNTRGKTDFVGGVSNGVRGVAAFEFEAAFTGTLKAHKSWYFFDDYILAIGENITCQTTNTVETSINQCLLVGDVYASISDQPLPHGSHTLSVPKLWVHHNQIGYYFPPYSNGAAQLVTLSNDDQSGTWESIGASTGNVTEEVFSMWISHPQSSLAPSITTDASYAYFVAPGIDLNTFETLLPKIQSVSIVVDSDFQGAQSNVNGNEVTGITFWSIASANMGSFTVKPSVPGLVLIDRSTNGIQLSFSDPTQLLTGKVTIILDGLQYKGSNCEVQGTMTTVTFTLPEGDMAGSSVQIFCTS